MNGGKREGAGRPKGLRNKTNDEIRGLLDANVDFTEVIRGLVELSKGITVERVVKDARLVFTEKPDPVASKILLEYRFGKPVQQIEAEVKGEITEIRRTVISKKVG